MKVYKGLTFTVTYISTYNNKLTINLIIFYKKKNKMKLT